LNIDDLAAANVQLFLLTDYVGNDAARVSAASRAKHIPCITDDIALARNGTCVMGVRSEPRIEIFRRPGRRRQQRHVVRHRLPLLITAI
jgi:hypothetical protein